MEFGPLIEMKRARLAALEDEMGNPEVFGDPKKAADVGREHVHLKKVLALWGEFEGAKRELEGNRDLVRGGDEEMAAMAAEEIPGLEEKVEALDVAIQYALLPRDPTEDRDAIFEIRAGTGGDEASLFAGDLFRMYSRFVEQRGWKLEPLDSSESDVGGFKEVTFKVMGEEVFRILKYESGVHRVQRVPSTETQGRIHTSTATVAVLPEAEEVDVELRPEDLKIEACRASGPGGQGVNTTDSAVQVWHLPTGLFVKCKEGRSQAQNKERALAILRAKILEKKQQEETEKYSEHRRKLIGSGERSEKIRTYNYPQNRVTDHRIGLTLHNLDVIMTGQIQDLIDGLQASEMGDRLKEAGLG